MNFISCKRDPHKGWGINDPVNLDHCLTYSGGIVTDRQSFEEKEKAPAILFTMVGSKQPITWTFVDERHRDWELGRLQELSYVPRDVAGEMSGSGDDEVVPVRLQDDKQLVAAAAAKIAADMHLSIIKDADIDDAAKDYANLAIATVDELRGPRPFSVQVR